MKAAEICLVPVAAQPPGAGLDHIAFVEVFHREKSGAIVPVLGDSSSYAVFSLLRAFQDTQTEIARLRIAGRAVTPESLAALNCCLRGEKSPHRKWPWDRLPHCGHDSRYEWKAFVEHLGLKVE